MPKPIEFSVNGKQVSVSLDNEETPLLDVLRNELGLVGTRFGCGLEQCGCCMSAATKSLEEASKHPKDAAQAILNANPKGGKIDTLTQGFELTIPLYRTPETKDKRPFQVTDQNMTDTVNLMVEYGGLDAKAKDNPKAFYTNDYLPQGGS